MKPRIGSPLMAVPACIALLTASNALAAEDVTLTGGSFSGENSYRTLTITGEVRVNTYDPGDPDSGWLWIKAHEIHLTSSGTIDASGAGYQGDLDGAQGYDDGAGGTPQVPTSQLFPGGGGAHFGAGGPGNDDVCQPFLDAGGGTAYDTDPNNPLALAMPQHGMGSAGGAGCSGPPNGWVGPGGDGGGVIILDAGQIVLDGDLLADGKDAPDTLNAAPGAGAGGTIIIRAAWLTPGSGVGLFARGGSGVTSQVYSGSGGGGLIVLSTDDEPDTLIANSSAAGGPANGICSVHSNGGGPGLIEQVPGPNCNDADGDGHSNELCGGDDCDDGDPAIHPEGADTCDLVDNDCDGQVDEESDSLCPAGQFCNEEGYCEAEGVDAGPSPTGSSGGMGLDDEGGDCGCSLAPASRIGPIALLLTLSGLAGFARRRVKR